MRELYDVAEWLASAWFLANPQKRMPTSHGVLDKALFVLRSEGKLPEQIANKLTFAETRVGMRCLELPDILYCAQDANFTSEPNFKYLTTEVRLDDISAKRTVMDLGLKVEDVSAAGKRLAEVMESEVAREGADSVTLDAA